MPIPSHACGNSLTDVSFHFLAAVKFASRPSHCLSSREFRYLLIRISVIWLFGWLFPWFVVTYLFVCFFGRSVG
jgi:hypothetical protein